MKKLALVLIIILSLSVVSIFAHCDVIITNPSSVCFPATVDITSPAITYGSDSGLTYTYWKDAAATESYDTPETATEGTYYIKGDDGIGCTDIAQIIVTVNPLPVPGISGPSLVGIGTTGNIYSTEGGMTSYLWSVSVGGTITSGSTSNTITVTWNGSGAQSVSVNYTNLNNCTALSATVFNVSANAFPVAGNVIILGDPRAGFTLYATYNYSDAERDAEGTSIFKWYKGTSSDGDDPELIAAASSKSYRLTDSELAKYIGFSVTPVASTGATTGNPVNTITWVGPVINDPPLAASVSVSGSLNVNGGLTGHYTYSDNEGDIEFGSTYKWYSSGSLMGPYSEIAGETSIVHIISTAEQGRYFKFSVTPGAITGNHIGSQVFSSGYGPTNTKPYVGGVSASGSTSIGSLLTGNYTYGDVDGDAQDLGATMYKWMRGGVTIPGAVSKNYNIVSADEGYKLQFEVTPVSLTGYPDTGSPVLSSETATVFDGANNKPLALDVCIEGVRAPGNNIKGKYTFSYVHSNDDRSIYRWMRDNDTIPGETSIEYTLVAADINKDIYFVVIPKSKPPANKKGTAVKSNPLARITLPQDDYSVAVDEVILTSNVTGGVYSGTGVSNGKFSPSSVGIVGSPYTIDYLLNIVTSTTTCSQKAAKQIGVTLNPTYFDGFNTVYCHDNGTDIITVANLPSGSVPLGFSLTNPDGIVSQSGSTVTINPGLMRPGVNVDVLDFSYLYNTYIYRISRGFRIDSVSTSIQLVNINGAYCIDDLQKSISVSGTYPSGGTGIWTGAILSDQAASSASLNPLSGIAGLTYPITFQYKSTSGCYSAVLSKNVKINPLPDPSFTIGPSYNIDGAPVNLIPVQIGGLFLGNGVSGNRFFPAIAGLGNHEIKYTITDANNCTNNFSSTTSVRKAQGYFTDIPSVVCYSDTTYNVKIAGLPLSGVSIIDLTNTKHTVVHVPGADNADYNIPVTGAGPDTLVFSYNWDGISYDLFKPVFIDSLGQVTIGNLIAGDKICNNVTPFELFTSIAGGVFAGPVIGGYLDPTRATGLTAVAYTFTNENTGCFTTTKIPITIFPSPNVSFIPKDVCIENNSDSTFFINNTISADPVQSWLWEFSEAGVSGTKTKKEPGYLFTTGGIHLVKLTATTINGCSTKNTSTIDLGLKPVADFYWENECYHPNDSIKLFDNSSSFSSIVSMSWDFFDGDSLHTIENPAYPKKSVGYLPVNYIVRTKYPNCHDTIFKEILIRKTITLSADDYFENFESGNGGWIKDSKAVNSWIFGTPDRNTISYAASGTNAWFTKINSSLQNAESSSVESPCFDFTNIERPMISLNIWKKFDKNRDGAALQYKIGDNPDWNYLGTLNDGINWFNSTLIKGRPGGDQIGWTTGPSPDTSWVLASHKLDILKGKKDVKLRISYGSDGTSQNNEGTAFDDIWIGERTRNVLLEHFTNSSSPASKSSNVIVNGVVTETGADVINIQYHTNFPGTDQLYLDNPDDASARIIYYGLSRAPYSMIDGGTRKDFSSVYDFSSAVLDSSDLIRRSLISPSFDITLNTQVDGGVLIINSGIEALENLDEANITLYLVVTVKELGFVNASSNGERTFMNVFRKMIPDAGGTDLKKSWIKGDKVQLEEKTWTIENVYNASDIEIIAYIQNSITKEVYQAEKSSQNIRVTGIENTHSRAVSQFALFPNPVSDRVTVSFDKVPENGTNIWIYDFTGTILKMYKTGGSQMEYSINDLDFKNGIYLVHIFSDGFDYGYRRLIILEN